MRCTLALALCALAACHRAGEGSGPPIARFEAEVAAAQAALATCQLGLAPGAAAQVYGLGEPQQLTYARADREYDAGVILFDLGEAQACLAALAPPADCWGQSAAVQGLLLALPPACAQAVIGSLDAGSACADALECASGACNTASCPGSCAFGLDAGSTCAADGDCAGGLVCNVNVCASPGAAGNDCHKNNDCLAGLACITSLTRSNGGPTSPDGKCSAPLDGGAACDPEYANPCAPGFWCEAVADGGPSSGACVAQLPSGAPCTVGHGATGYTEALESAQCQGHQICAGLIVDSDGNVTTPGRCDVPHGLDGGCVQTGVAATQGCQLGLLCDPGGRCVAPPGAGSACAVPPSDNSGLGVDSCAPGLWCDASNTDSCLPKLADGAGGCVGKTSCLSASCDTSSFTCAPASPLGCASP